MTKDDAEILTSIQVRLNTAIMALREAKNVTPEHTRFRRIDKYIIVALDLATLARDICEANADRTKIC